MKFSTFAIVLLACLGACGRHQEHAPAARDATPFTEDLRPHRPALIYQNGTIETNGRFQKDCRHDAKAHTLTQEMRQACGLAK